MDRSGNYGGVEFIKNVKSVKSLNLQKAMTATFRGDFDAAERLFLQDQRPELAIQLRFKIGELDRSEHIATQFGCNSETRIQLWNAFGESHFDQCQWKDAAKFFNLVTKCKTRCLRIFVRARTKIVWWILCFMQTTQMD